MSHLNDQRLYEELKQAVRSDDGLSVMNKNCPWCDCKAFSKLLYSTKQDLKNAVWSHITVCGKTKEQVNKEAEQWQAGKKKTGFVCEGCGKLLANNKDALKAHAWIKVDCRAFIPDPMCEEIKSEQSYIALDPLCENTKEQGKEEAGQWQTEMKKTEFRCKGCNKLLANNEEALKAHASMKEACRRFIPSSMYNEIESEQSYIAPSESRSKPYNCGEWVWQDDKGRQWYRKY